MTRAGGAAAAACIGLLAAGNASAGGPLYVRSNGQPFTWSTAAAVQYRTDNGPLSATVNEAAARSRVQSMFAVWQNVASASIVYDRAGFISSAPGFSGGDVSNVDEYDAVFGDCADGNQSPIIFDPTAAIFIALGDDETSVIGFTGACDLNEAQGRIVSSHVVMNGLFQDGAANPVPDLTAAEFDATFIHEFGHFSGLDHSQINVGCANQFGPCSPDDLAGLPTMFPFLRTDEQLTPSIDDIAWISKLYPAGGGAGFSATHGTIRGRVYFSDGVTQAQSVNVIARRVDTGSNEDRRFAASGVSGYRFHGCRPNPITNPPPSDCSGSGSDDPTEIGLYEIPVPAGTYTIEVESIDPQFVGGSGVGPSSRPVPMPGQAPAPLGPITISAGQTSTGNDFVLLSTPPRFDQFEGPEP